MYFVATILALAVASVDAKNDGLDFSFSFGATGEVTFPQLNLKTENQLSGTNG